jgi:hypothetical protein
MSRRAPYRNELAAHALATALTSTAAPPLSAGRNPEPGTTVRDQQSATHRRIARLPDRPASAHTLNKGGPKPGHLRASPFRSCTPTEPHTDEDAAPQRTHQPASARRPPAHQAGLFTGDRKGKWHLVLLTEPHRSRGVLHND